MERLLMTINKIVLIPFPFDDLSGNKVRPAVCLSEPIGIHRHVVLAFITSQVIHNSLPSDLIIRSTDSDFSLTGLQLSSTLRLHRMMTVTSSLIRRELGQLSPRLQEQVKKKLIELFSL